MSNASDFVIKKGVLEKYKGPGGDVVIPEGVKEIGYGAFEGRNSLMSVVIPDGVTEIGWLAFSGCESLTSVRIPEGVKKIGQHAFSRCKSLSNVVIPGSITEIEVGAFRGCKALADQNGCVVVNNILFDYVGPGGDVVITEGVAELDERVFWSVNLSSLSIPGSVTKIDYKSFVDDEIKFWWGLDSGSHRIQGECSIQAELKNFYVAEGNKTYSEKDGVVFSKNGKKLVLFPYGRESFTVPEGVTHIMKGAFFGALGLKCLVLPESLTNISGDAIRCTGLTYLRLPPAVTKLAKNAVDVSYVSFYHAAIADNVKYGIYLGGGIEDIPVKARNAAVKGFLYAMQNNIEEIKAFEDSYVEYIGRNIKTYCKSAASDEFLLQWMVQKKLIPENELEKLLQTFEKENQPELVALLLNYKNAQFEYKEDVFSLESQDAESRRIEKVARRRAELENQCGINGVAFVVTGEMKKFGNYNPYTGFWDYKDLKSYIEERGGYLRSAVSGKTDYLICNDPNSCTEKMKVAKELGVTIITEDEFLAMAEQG